MGKTYNIPSSWITYYEEGKVPFCTKCPICKNPTKLNYIIHITGIGSNDRTETIYGNIIQVYCDKHYKYDCKLDKHYKMDVKGCQHICPIQYKSRQSRSDQLFIQYSCEEGIVWWNQTDKWIEWDSTDPDGKRAEEERKQKEIEDIKQQITELQTKLAALNSPS